MGECLSDCSLNIFYVHFSICQHGFILITLSRITLNVIHSEALWELREAKIVYVAFTS